MKRELFITPVLAVSESDDDYWICLASSHPLNDRWLSPDAFPDNKFSTLISSSRSGQWIPSPFPIKRQLLRSCAVPCRSLGYQPIGTETVRPSDKSILIVSSL